MMTIKISHREEDSSEMHLKDIGILAEILEERRCLNLRDDEICRNTKSMHYYFQNIFTTDI